jgi:hypothetical protein
MFHRTNLDQQKLPQRLGQLSAFELDASVIGKIKRDKQDATTRAQLTAGQRKFHSPIQRLLIGIQQIETDLL